jgi:hypothetical protein
MFPSPFARVGQKMSFHTVLFWNSEPRVDYDNIKEIRRWAIAVCPQQWIKIISATNLKIMCKQLQHDETQETDFCEEETEKLRALPWLRCSVLGFSVLRPQFYPCRISCGTEIDFSRVLPTAPVNFIPPVFHIHSSVTEPVYS